jgi:hypothetical protein
MKKMAHLMFSFNQIQITFIRTSVLIPIQITNGFTNLEKADMVLIYGEACGHSDLARQIYGERVLQTSKDTF